MTDHEEKIINESIKSYQNMIEYLNKQIEILSAKKNSKCCFEKTMVHKILIKDK